ISAIYSSNKVYRYTFDSGLTIKPTLVALGSISGPIGVRVVSDKYSDEKYAYITSMSGDLHRFQFSTGFSSSPEKENLGKFGVLNANYSFSLYEESGISTAFTINSNRNVYRFNFPDKCASVSKGISVEVEPAGLHYNQPGTYNITLIGTTGEGQKQSLTKQITILNQQAPQIKVHQGE